MPAVTAETSPGAPRSVHAVGASAETLVRAVRVPLDLLGGKWVVAVLVALGQGPLRRADLRRVLDPLLAGMRLHDKVLTETLRRMEEQGLLGRTVTAGLPPTVTYYLTPVARSVFPLIEHLAVWASRHAHELPSAE